MAEDGVTNKQSNNTETAINSNFLLTITDEFVEEGINDESSCYVFAPFLKPNSFLLIGFSFNVVSSNSHKIRHSDPSNKVCIKKYPLKDFACLRLQCLTTIPGRLLNKPYGNEVTLRGQNIC